MTKSFYSAAVCAGLVLIAPAASAQGYTDLFEDHGIAGTIARLETIAQPTPSDEFALGAARFLRAMEFSLQERYRYGLGDDAFSLTGTAMLSSNPSPEPFEAEVLNTYFDTMIATLTDAAEALEAIEDGDDVAVDIDTSRLWLDVNANGQRDEGEALIDVMLPMFVNPWEMEETLAAMEAMGGPPKVRFDTADAAWLAAYAHVIAASAEFLYAFDPATTTAELMAAENTIDTLRGAPEIGFILGGDGDSAFLNAIAMLTETMENQPDPARTQAAHGHLLAMIENNKVFWARVRAETDNEREWIPNDTQTSALPLEFPQGIGETWQTVLAEVEAVLNGELLIPHWRLGDFAGIDLKAWMENPAPLDLVGVIHGFAFEDHMRRGPVASFESMREFERQTDFNTGLFMLALN